MKNKKLPLQERAWFKIDNAGKIFPGQNNSKWSNVFRISVSLKSDIDKSILENALKDMLPRFPCYDVRIRRGIFWCYFEKQQGVYPPISEDIGNPCHRVNFRENNRFLLRLYVYGNRLSAEFFHALTDAYGACVFLMTLAAQYLRLKGAEIPSEGMVLNLKQEASKEELEDSFIRFANSKAKVKRSSDFVYHAKGERIEKHRINVTTGYIDCDAFYKKAKEYNATITELASAILLDIHYRKQLRENRRQKIVSVQIPVNLRNHFPSKTLRNFSLCYNIKLDPKKGEYTFEEIVKHVALSLRLVNNAKELNAMMTKNLALEKNFFMRIMPLFIKKAGIYSSFALTGEKTVSALFSNVGRVSIPDRMKQYIESIMLMTGPGILNGARLGAITFENTLAISFANIYKDKEIEREFFTRIVKMGVHVKIESNREQEG